MCSAASVADFFEVSPRTVQRAFGELRELGFFVLIESGKRLFEKSVYGVLTHKQWAQRNPGCCTTKHSDAYADEYELDKRLWAASGGQVRFLPFELQELKSTGFSESEIISLFEAWYPVHKTGQQGKTWRKACAYEFFQHIRREARSRNCRSPRDERSHA
jgi:hypothetical protein